MSSEAGEKWTFSCVTCFLISDSHYVRNLAINTLRSLCNHMNAFAADRLITSACVCVCFFFFLLKAPVFYVFCCFIFVESCYLKC